MGQQSVAAYARQHGVSWHTAESRVNKAKRAALVESLFQGIPSLPDKSIIGYAPWDEQRRRLHRLRWRRVGHRRTNRVGV